MQDRTFFVEMMLGGEVLPIEPEEDPEDVAISMTLILLDVCIEHMERFGSYFKESKDPRMVPTYELLKKAFAEARMMWPEHDSRG